MYMKRKTSVKILVIVLAIVMLAGTVLPLAEYFISKARENHEHDHNDDNIIVINDPVTEPEAAPQSEPDTIPITEQEDITSDTEESTEDITADNPSADSSMTTVYEASTDEEVFDAPLTETSDDDSESEAVVLRNENSLASAPPEEFQAFTTYLYKDNRHDMPLSEELQYWTYQMCEKYDVPYRIIMGLMGVETGWNENTGIEIGYNGRAYVGLGCLDEVYNAESFAERGIDIYTNQGNIEAICWIINYNLEHFDNNIDYALMAYNGGAGYARNKINNGVYSTGYTEKVHYYADSLE